MRNPMSFFDKLMPHIAMVMMEIASAGLIILAKDIFTHGTSSFVFIVYEHIVSTLVLSPVAYFLERGKRPPLTFELFCCFFLLAFLGISLSQNLLSASLYFNSATFQSAMLNMIPPVTFVLAAVFRQERIDMTKRHDQAKVVGTVISVGGAMVMTLWNGSMLKTVRYQNQNSPRNDLATTGSWIIGSVILFVGIMSWSIWILLQASSWALKWDLKLLVIFYGGILCTGFGYFVQTWCAYKRGPIFVSMYNPLLILFSAIMEALIVGESLYVGSVVGALMIVAGLCALLWGKAKDEASTEYPLPPNTNSASVITQPLMPGAGLS